MKFFYCFLFYRKYRYVAYRKVVRWCWGWLGKDIRVQLPACVHASIMEAYPDGRGQYKGTILRRLRWGCNINYCLANFEWLSSSMWLSAIFCTLFVIIGFHLHIHHKYYCLNFSWWYGCYELWSRHLILISKSWYSNFCKTVIKQRFLMRKNVEIYINKQQKKQKKNTTCLVPSLLLYTLQCNLF